MPGTSEWQRYSGLLHDARVQHVEWDQSLAQMSLCFSCLRRHSDGSAVPDPVVEFKLAGVVAIVVGYESGLLPGPRPSTYHLRGRLTAEDFQQWSFQAEEAYFTVNSAGCVDDALHSPISDRLLGGLDDLEESSLRIGLTFSHTGILGMPTNTINIVIGCDSIETLSSGVPLGLDTWEEQFAAWWQGWKKHWDHKGDGDDATPCQEDTFIPAGQSPPSDRTYRPPQEPTVEWQATEAPAELLQSLAEWFEGRMQEDWLRVARAEPQLDYSDTEWAEKLKDRTDYDFGRWYYARQVDDWWVEGNHVEVIVRGVEHVMPDEESPASNVETVWTFKLRKRSGRWTIRTYSLGWPPFGSAPAKPSSAKPWMRRWKSGRIKTRR